MFRQDRPRGRNKELGEKVGMGCTPYPHHFV